MIDSRTHLQDREALGAASNAEYCRNLSRFFFRRSKEEFDKGSPGYMRFENFGETFEAAGECAPGDIILPQAISFDGRLLG